MQIKQQSLLKRVDALDKECEELHGQLGKWREKHYDLQHQHRHTSEEKEEVHVQLAAQQVRVNAPEDTVVHVLCREVRTEPLSFNRTTVQSSKGRSKDWRATLLSSRAALQS